MTGDRPAQDFAISQIIVVDDPDRDQNPAVRFIGDIADEKLRLFALAKNRSFYLGGAEICEFGEHGLQCWIRALQT